MDKFEKKQFPESLTVDVGIVRQLLFQLCAPTF